jgi:hypothetical protein
MKYEELGKGFIKKRERKTVGLFIDGTGLDRATRRINRKVDMAALVRGVTSGITPTVARYYTLIPYEDDSRQRAFLDAVARAGLSVIVKRLPPKGVNRQVSVDLEMAADMVAFALGLTSFSKENEYLPADLLAAVQGYPNGPAPVRRGAPLQVTRGGTSDEDQTPDTKEDSTPRINDASPSQRKVVVVCPSRDLSYPIGLIKDLGADTTNADFGQFTTGDILKSASKWIDLSDSETIWRD